MFGNFAVGWRQVWLSIFLLATTSMITMTYGLIAVALEREFAPSRMALMLTLSIVSAGVAAVSPGLGILMDRISLRRIMIAGSLALPLGYFLLSYVTAFYQVLVVFGLFMAPGQVAIGTMAVTVLLSRWFSAMRGRALGIAITGISLGGFSYPIVVQTLLDHFDWRSAMRILALIVALVVVPSALLVIDRPAARGFHPDGAREEPEHGDVASLHAGLSTRAVVSDPTFWMLAVLLALFFSGMRGLVANIAPLAVDEGVDPMLVGYLLSIYSIGGVIAKLGFAALADRLNPRILLLVAMIGACFAHGCMVLAEQGLAMIVLGVAAMGLFGGTILPLQSFLVPRIFGRHIVGRVSGLLGLAMFVFNFSAPPLFGLIYDLFGSYDVIFAAYALLLLAATLLVPRIRLHPRDYSWDEAPVPAS